MHPHIFSNKHLLVGLWSLVTDCADHNGTIDVRQAIILYLEMPYEGVYIAVPGSRVSHPAISHHDNTERKICLIRNVVRLTEGNIWKPDGKLWIYRITFCRPRN